MARTTTAAKKRALPLAPAKKAPAKAAKKDAPIVVARTGDVKEIAFTKNMTVAEALQAAGYSFETADEVRLNNRKVTGGGTKLSPGDQLLVLGKIRGA